MAIFTYDPVGNLAANLIQNELAQVNSINGLDHNYIIPLNAPFYGNGLVVVDEASGQILTPGVDYELTHEFRDMTAHVNTAVYGSFTFTDPNRTGNFRIRYQTLGGDFVDATTQALTDGLDALANLQTIDWDDIIGVPATFPPSPHTQPVTDIESVQQAIDAIQACTAAIAANSRHIHIADIIDLETEYVNPLFALLQDIATELRNQVITNQLYSEQITPGNVDTDLGAKPADTWFDLPLQLSPATGLDGRYKISHSVDIVTVPATDFRVRFVIDDAVLAKSYLNGAIMGLNDSMVVKVQAMVKGTPVTSCKIANVDHSSQLTIERHGN